MSDDTISPKLRVWWIPAIPGEPFCRTVRSISEGFQLLDALVDYTRYLETERDLLPVYAADAGGIEILEGDEWVSLDDDWEYASETADV